MISKRMNFNSPMSYSLVIAVLINLPQTTQGYLVMQMPTCTCENLHWSPNPYSVTFKYLGD